MSIASTKEQRQATRKPESISEEEKRVALSPTTTQERLQEIFDADASLDFCLVQNPNLPFALLLRLAETYPTQAIENPYLALRLLEDPSLIQSFSPALLGVLIQLDHLPSWLVEVLWAEPKVQRTIVFASPRFAAHWLPRLMELEPWPGVMETFLWAVARHPDATIEQMKTSAAHPLGKVREDVAGNKNLPLSLADSLRKDPHNKTRERIAARRDIPVEWLDELAEDTAHEVRLAVARNPKTPTSALAKIALHPKNGSRIRQALAEHPSAPSSLLEEYLRGTESNVAGAAFANPLSLDAALVMCLSETDLERSLVYWTMIAKNPALPVDRLRELAKHPHPPIRLHVAQNPNTPVASLVALADDADFDVRDTVAEHPNTPMETLLRLRDDPDDVVASTVYWRLQRNGLT